MTNRQIGIGVSQLKYLSLKLILSFIIKTLTFLVQNQLLREWSWTGTQMSSSDLCWVKYEISNRGKVQIIGHKSKYNAEQIFFNFSNIRIEFRGPNKGDNDLSINTNPFFKSRLLLTFLIKLKKKPTPNHHIHWK